MPVASYTKEHTCKICNLKLKNEKSIGSHLRSHHISYEEYCSKFNIPYSETTTIKNYQCKICHKYIPRKALGYHLKQNHNISTKEYYDKFYKKETVGICQHTKCNTNTLFLCVGQGYRKYCSCKCSSTDTKLNDQKMENRKQTYINNPLLEKSRRDTLSIIKRNSYNLLVDVNSTIPYFLYIVEHLTKPIIKIGRSKNPKIRLDGIIRDFGTCKIIHILKGKHNYIQALESYLHDHFNDYCKVQPSGSGRTEWFDRSILNESIKLIDKFKTRNLT